ncbi:MAG: PsiF family protein [Rhodanobacter sp.]|jgi:hypothetical protein
MSLSLRLLAVSAAFALAGTAFAASPATPAATAKPHTAQQQRMIDCNHQATGKKGAERKAFMSSCLKGHASASAAASTDTTQHAKMKSCNTDATAKALKGAERKAFMSSCLKGGAAAAP